MYKNYKKFAVFINLFCTFCHRPTGLLHVVAMYYLAHGSVKTNALLTKLFLWRMAEWLLQNHSINVKKYFIFKRLHNVPWIMTRLILLTLWNIPWSSSWHQMMTGYWCDTSLFRVQHNELLKKQEIVSYYAVCHLEKCQCLV